MLRARGMRALLGFAGAVCMAATARGQAPEVALGSATGVPNGRGCVPLTLHGHGTSVVGVSADVVHDEELDIDPAKDCALQPTLQAAGYTGECNLLQARRLRCAVYHGSLQAIPDGDLLTCCFQIKSAAHLGPHPLAILCGASTLEGDVPTMCESGVVLVVEPSATPAPTPTPTVVPCAGDCGGDSRVTVDEILTMVNVALGNASPLTCEGADSHHDGQVTVDEILTAVSNALNGCK